VFIEMFDSGTAVVNSECMLVFVLPYSEIASSLSNISFLTIRASQFKYSGRGEFVRVLDPVY